MTILVTGSAGFIGAHVAKALRARGDEVLGLDNFNDYYDPKLKRDRVAALLGSEQTTHEIDLADEPALGQFFADNAIDKICHLAAQAGVRYSLENPGAYIRSNIIGTHNIFEQARKHQIQDVVFASSSSVYGGNTKVPFSETDPVNQPLSLYAATKRSNELEAFAYHHLHGLRCTGLRFFTVYGPWGRPDMALYKFSQKIAGNQAIDVYNNGHHSRDFTYIDDIVRGVLAAIDTPQPYEIVNLGNNAPTVLEDFIGLIETALGKKAQKNYLPLQPGDVVSTYADITKAQKLFGFQPATSLEQGIPNFISWFKKYHCL